MALVVYFVAVDSDMMVYLDLVYSDMVVYFDIGYYLQDNMGDSVEVDNTLV